MNPWHLRRERGSSLGIWIVTSVYRYLGRPFARALVLPIVVYFWLTAPEARRASRSYLRRVAASPGGALIVGEAPGAGQVFRHFMSFGLSIFDRVGFWLGRRGDFAFEVVGAAHLDRIASEGRGALLLGAHLGSFDAMRLLAERSPIPVNVLMYTKHARRINAAFESLADASGQATPTVRVIAIVPGSMQHVMRARACVERGEVVAILADRIGPSEWQQACRVKFLGGAALLPTAPFRLAALLGTPVFLMTALRTGASRYEIEVEELADGLHLPRQRSTRDEVLGALCQAYADRLAVRCLRAPYQWFNFFDFWIEGESKA